MLGLNKARNQVVLGFAGEADCSGLEAENIYFSDGLFPSAPFNCTVKIRYNAKPAEATVEPDRDAGKVKVKFARPLRGIAPGQAVVFYDDTICLGGGTIVRSLSAH